MMCAYLLAPRREDRHGRLYRAGEQAFAAILVLNCVEVRYFV
jgi:hypothetical protein